MISLEKFTGIFAKFPAEFLWKLDRNSRRLENVANAGPVATTLSGYTLKDDDLVESLQVNANTAAVTIYLPASPTGNRRRTITKTDASVNVVTVNGNGNNINGAASQPLAAQYDSITVEPTGTEWLIVASYP